MDENDRTDPSATGILHCLKLLAQEAAALNLIRTLSAIEDALETAACESGTDMMAELPGIPPERPVIH